MIEKTSFVPTQKGSGFFVGPPVKPRPASKAYVEELARQGASESLVRAMRLARQRAPIEDKIET